MVTDSDSLNNNDLVELPGSGQLQLKDGERDAASISPHPVRARRLEMLEFQELENSSESVEATVPTLAVALAIFEVEESRVCENQFGLIAAFEKFDGNQCVGRHLGGLPGKDDFARRSDFFEFAINLLGLARGGDVVHRKATAWTRIKFDAFHFVPRRSGLAHPLAVLVALRPCSEDAFA
jgi:hypothetical protein